MYRAKYKGKQVKRKLPRFDCTCRTYGDLMYRAADDLAGDERIVSVRTNVPISIPSGEYTSDFVCQMKDGGMQVYECIERNALGRPKTAALLNESCQYWTARGAKWGLYVSKEQTV